MRLERELALVFLEEARAHARALADEEVPREGRVKAAAELRGAAGLVGLTDVQAAAGEAERWLRAGDATRARAHVAQITELLARLAREAEAAAGEGGPRRSESAFGLPATPDGGAARQRRPVEDDEPLPDLPFAADEAEVLHQFFREEALEHLDGINAALLDLEKHHDRRDLIDELLRKTHTLKGSAATVGLGPISEAAHMLEEAFIRLRAGRLSDDDAVFDVLMSASDTLRALVDAARSPEVTRPLLERLRALIAIVTPGDTPTNPPIRSATPAVPRRISLRETGPITVPTLDGGSGSEPKPEPGSEPKADPGANPEDWEAAAAAERRLAERRAPDASTLRVDVARVDGLMDGVGELVFDRTRIERRVQELRAVVRDLGKTRAWLRATLAPLRTAAASAGAANNPIDQIAASAARLEGELAAHVAHLSRTSGSLLEDTDALRRTTATLQDGLTQVRMMSVRFLFQRMARPLRDIARREGKRIELVVSGEDTELDRTVAEKITDPLIQLLRNAVAHGIESAGRRVEVGKPPTGRITLAARHQGDSFFLEVSDDGAGIDPDRIRASLVASGKMSGAEAATASDERIIASIFETGVSTREEADELAGRGVGLDVVRDAIARLGGEITVTSASAEGTHFAIRLPLTMSVAQAFLFKVGAQVYALPNVHVVETTWLEASSPAMPSHLRVRDDPVPLVALHRLLGAEMPADARRVPAVVIEFAGRRLAATCDKVIGPREITVKSLGPLLAPLGLYAGATISGAGKVQLILDPSTLAQVAYPTKPTMPATEPPLAGSADTTSSGGAVQLPPARILLADDSRAVREAVSRMLSAAGHIVDVAVDGREAWDMLQDVRYDLLITDVEMPRLSGLDLLARLRASPSHGALPALVISSRAAAAQRDRAEKAGATAFLGKPVTRLGLTAEIDKLLRRRP